MNSHPRRNHINLFHKSTPVAQISMSESGQFILEYHQKYLDREDAISLSPLLPLSKPYQVGRAVQSYVYNLFPENNTVLETLQSISPHFRTSLFYTLNLMGKDLPGKFYVADRSENQVRSKVPVQTVFPGELDQLLIQTQLNNGMFQEGVTVGGKSPKLTLGYSKKDGWFKPGVSLPSTHILKPDPINMPGNSMVEFIATQIAQDWLAEVNRVDLRPMGNMSRCLVVERFDRRVYGENSGETVREHMVDFRQAVGLMPETPVENSWGYDIGSLNQLFDFYDPYMRHNLINILIFNAEIGNITGKNISLRHVKEASSPHDSWELTPAYGITSHAGVPLCNQVYDSPLTNIQATERYIFNLAEGFTVTSQYVYEQMYTLRRNLPELWVNKVNQVKNDFPFTPAEEQRVVNVLKWLMEKSTVSFPTPTTRW